MPIPNDDAINEFLGSLTIEEPASPEVYDRFEVIPEAQVSNLRSWEVSKAIWVWYERSCKMSASGMIKRLEKEIRHGGHWASPRIARAILAFVPLITKKLGSPVDRLNAMLERIADADVIQYLICPYPPHPDNFLYRVGEFSVGPLQRQQLVYRCEKVNCNFFQLYPDQFQDQFAIERAPSVRRMIDFPAFHHSFLTKGSNDLQLLRDHYYRSVAGDLLKDFRTAYWDAHYVLISAGAPFTDIDAPAFMIGTSTVTVIQNIGGSQAGFFAQTEAGLAIDFAQAGRRVPEKARELKDRFGFTGLGNSELHQTIRTYSHFVTRATRHKIQGNVNEAYLHLVIALDLLFGDKNAATESVTKRTATVLSGGSAMLYEVHLSRLAKHYDKRSRYVHQGVAVSDEDYEALQPVNEEILFCLLRLQAVDENLVNGFVDRWLTELDYFAGAFVAEKDISRQDLEQAGILPPV